MLLLFVMFLYIDHFFFEFVCFFFYWVIVNYFKLIAYSTLLSFDANEIISDLGLIFATNQQHILCPPFFSRALDFLCDCIETVVASYN